MGRLPHLIVTSSRIPRLFGHQAITLGPLCFFEPPMPRRAHRRHEYRHVVQWYAGWLVGAAVILALGLSWPWLMLAPLTFPLAYLAGLAIWGYDAHPAERDARRYAVRDD